jgi:hypothetical protein
VLFLYAFPYFFFYAFMFYHLYAFLYLCFTGDSKLCDEGAPFMKVILFASQKGGSSKTTLCRCLAVAADQAGVGSIGMIDTDPQGTLTKWWKRRAAQTPNLLRLRSVRDDLAPTLEAASAACKV